MRNMHNMVLVVLTFTFLLMINFGTVSTLAMKTSWSSDNFEFSEPVLQFFTVYNNTMLPHGDHKISGPITVTLPMCAKLCLQECKFYSRSSFINVSDISHQRSTSSNFCQGFEYIGTLKACILLLANNSEQLGDLKPATGTTFYKLNNGFETGSTHVTCSNGGTCVKKSDSYVCACAVGFTGDHCEINANHCLNVPCLFGGVCVITGNTYRCDCPIGVTGVHCDQYIGDCYNKPCRNNGTCKTLSSGYACVCPLGFTGSNCEYNINECFSSPCKFGQCVDDINGYSCVCDRGFRGDRCEINNAISMCVRHNCRFGTCAVNASGSYCQCFPGFGGESCEINIDDCESSPCAHGDCVDHINSFHCKCSHGYVGQRCDLLAEDPCRNKPCLHGFCSVTKNGFKCICEDGYTGEKCETPLTLCDIWCAQGFCVSEGQSIDLICVCFDGFTGRFCTKNVDNECMWPDISCKNKTFTNRILSTLSPTTVRTLSQTNDFTSTRATTEIYPTHVSINSIHYLTSKSTKRNAFPTSRTAIFTQNMSPTTVSVKQSTKLPFHARSTVSILSTAPAYHGTVKSLYPETASLTSSGLSYQTNRTHSPTSSNPDITSLNTLGSTKSTIIATRSTPAEKTTKHPFLDTFSPVIHRFSSATLPSSPRISSFKPSTKPEITQIQSNVLTTSGLSLSSNLSPRGTWIWYKNTTPASGTYTESGLTEITLTKYSTNGEETQTPFIVNTSTFTSPTPNVSSSGINSSAFTQDLSAPRWPWLTTPLSYLPYPNTPLSSTTISDIKEMRTKALSTTPVTKMDNRLFRNTTPEQHKITVDMSSTSTMTVSSKNPVVNATPDSVAEIVTVESLVIGALFVGLVIVTCVGGYFLYKKRRSGSVYINSTQDVKPKKRDTTGVKKRYSSREIHSELRSGRLLQQNGDTYRQRPEALPGMLAKWKARENVYVSRNHFTARELNDVIVGASEASGSAGNESVNTSYYDDVETPFVLISDPHPHIITDRSFHTCGVNNSRKTSVYQDKHNHRKRRHTPPVNNDSGSAGSYSDISLISNNPFFRDEYGALNLKLSPYQKSRTEGEMQLLLEEVLDTMESPPFTGPGRRSEVYHISGTEGGKSYV